MQWLLLTPPALALLVLAAHFHRAGAWPMVAACVALVALLGLRRTWVPRLLGACLVAGAVVWLWTGYRLLQMRMDFGQPWTRLALILGVVAVLTAVSALVFRTRASRRWFGRE